MSKKVERRARCGRMVVFEVADHFGVPEGEVVDINDCDPSIFGPTILITMGLIRIGDTIVGAHNIYVK